MKQDNLLLKDLSGRVPYKPKFKFGNNVYTLYGIDYCVDDDGKRVQDYGDLNGDLNGANNIALKFISDIYDTIKEQRKLETPVYKFDTNLNRFLNKVKSCKLKRSCNESYFS